MKRSLALGFLICFLFIRPAIAQSQDADEPEANPGRPTVSTPATLTPVGYLQFESGFTAARNSGEFSSRYGFNHGLTHTSTQWEVFAGFTYLLPRRLWNPHAFQRATTGPY